MSTNRQVTVASQTALPSTVMVPSILTARVRQTITFTVMRNWSPGVTWRRNLARSMPVKTVSISARLGISVISRVAPDCAIASTMSTPGITGLPGKCPRKNSSLAVTFLMVTIRFFRSNSITRSISRNG